MNESSFTASLRRYAPEALVIRKFSDRFNAGVSDTLNRVVTGIGNERELWVEYKYLHALPKRDSTIVVPDLSQAQLDFFTETRNANGFALCALGFDKDNVVLFPQEFEVSGLPVSAIKANAMTRKQWVKTIYDFCRSKIDFKDLVRLTYPNQ